MEYNTFEQHISGSLRSEEVTLDIQGLIDDIHGKKKKRRTGFIWLWAVLGMVLLGSGTILVSKMVNKDIPSQLASEELMVNNAVTNISEVKPENNILNNSPIANNNHIPTKKNIKVSSEWMVTDSDHISVDKDMASTSVLDENMAVEKLENSMNIYETNLSEMAQRKINLTAALENKNILSIQAIENKPPFIGRDKIVCPTFSNNGKLYLEIIPELGAFLPIKNLENSSVEPNNVFTKRNTDEKSLEGLNAGLYLRLSKEKSPFYIKAGLSWSRLSEKMPLTYSYTRKDTTQGIISVTVSQTGDTITYIYGDIIQERKISGNKTKHYSISMLDLPMAVGAEKRFGSWFAGIEAGLYLNLSMKSTGNLLASDTSFVSIDTPVEYFKRSIGLSYFGGIHVGKEFKNAGRIFLAARARFIPESFSTDQNRIRQTYQFAGLNLGYVYTF